MPAARLFLLSGALLAALAVVLGAFAAHALKARLEEAMLAAFQTGVRYQMMHALALLLIGTLMCCSKPASTLADSRALVAGGLLLLLGSLLFSGSLYALALTDIRWFGPLTPLGGVAFVFGWVLVMVAVLRADFRRAAH